VREGVRHRPQVSQTPLETVLKSRAIELWVTGADRLFLVADEDDARQAFERFGAVPWDIYTVAEGWRVIAVNDPTVVAEIHEWKREFNAVLSDQQPGRDH